METTRQLINVNRDKTMGNHKVENFVEGNDRCRSFVYFYTAIVVTNDTKKTFTVANGGHDTNSTNKAISSYVCELESAGYTLVLHDVADIDYCEAKYYRLDVKNIQEVTKKELAGETLSVISSGTVVKCGKYHIFYKWNGGRTLVTNEAGFILDKLPQYIKDFIAE